MEGESRHGNKVPYKFIVPGIPTCFFLVQSNSVRGKQHSESQRIKYSLQEQVDGVKSLYFAPLIDHTGSFPPSFNSTDCGDISQAVANDLRPAKISLRVSAIWRAIFSRFVSGRGSPHTSGRYARFRPCPGNYAAVCTPRHHTAAALSPVFKWLANIFAPWPSVPSQSGFR